MSTLQGCARLLGEVAFPSPYGTVGIAFYEDPFSQRIFGIDSSFVEQEVEDRVPDPFVGGAILDITDEGAGQVRAVHFSAGLVPVQVCEDVQALEECWHQEKYVRYIGVLRFPDPVSQREKELSLFESSGLFAIESDFLAQGSVIADPFQEAGRGTLDLSLSKTGRSSTLVQVQLQGSLCA